MANIKKRKKASLDPKNNTLSLEDTYESNLPTPEDLEKYEKIVKWWAKKIFEMAEKEQDFRHKAFPKLVNKFFIISFVWLITAFIIVLALLYFSYLLIEKWESIKAIWLLVTTIWIIWTSFILKIKWFNDTDNTNKKLKKPKK